MTPAQIKLLKELRQANLAYSKGMPYLTDSEYDILWQKVHSFSPDCSDLYHSSNDPTLPYGDFKHFKPVLGTDRVFETSELKAFLLRHSVQRLLIQPKYDGVGAVWYKQHDEQPDRLVLQGDGLVGKDISHILPKITWNYTKSPIESVELIIPNSKWKSAFGKNPRNTVAGWIARHEEFPEFVVHAIPHNHTQHYHLLEPPHDLDALDELFLGLYEHWKKIFPLDGLMLKLADEHQRLVVGGNGNVFKWQIAWKPPMQTAWTTVTDIEWNVSRSGRVIPTIVYSPIELCGTTNSRVTANNATWLQEKKITPGASILVGKAGEIIPKILDVKHGTNLELPASCPMCFAQLTWKGVDLICTAPDCISQLSKSLAYFYSDKCLDVKTIGEKMLAELLQSQPIRSLLAEKPWALLDPWAYDIIDDLIKIWGLSRTDNYLNSVDDIHGKKDYCHFIAGLGKPSLGYKTALTLYQAMKGKQLTKKVQLDIIHNFLAAYQKVKLCMKETDFKLLEPPKPASKTYCITGKLSCSRADMIEYLTRYNFAFSSSVTKQTDFLLLGELKKGSNKLAKARQYELPIYSEYELPIILKEEEDVRSDD